MVLTFVVALLRALSRARRRRKENQMSTTEIDRQWTTRLRRRVDGKLPPEKMLPDTQPTYVVVVDLRLWRGHPVVTRRGHRHRLHPGDSRAPVVARLVNRSLHQLPAPLERGDLLLHHGHPPLGQVRHGRLARRARAHLDDRRSDVLRLDRRRRFTGYVSQSNFDSQWISTQAKDGINATGAGAYFNVLNMGQMLMWHIVLLPIGAVVLTGLHVLMVRIKGVVPPFEEAAEVAE